MLKAIVFDFNGVFVKAPEMRVLNRLCSVFGTGKWIALSNYALLINKFETGLISPLEFWKRVFVTLSEKDFYSHVEAEYELPVERNSSLFRIAENLAEKYELYCISNSNFMQGKAYRKQKLYTPFKEFFLSHETGLMKPFPSSFRYFLGKTGLRANECLFIDDSPINIAVAKTFGFRTILYKNNLQFENKLEKFGISIQDSFDSTVQKTNVSSQQI